MMRESFLCDFMRKFFVHTEQTKSMHYFGNKKS